ncbi:hypothetical protein M406DRAFT_341102 [Cryphonectria parasitica EP155]|uniref:F-box domain-containing protein n=1 Tax=Cryphonectria parasitica (strain ATCC 38755 / EP155) TaxID=660469 RepID=A0A9P5CM10_CRYP1|nr:uncharacterized protein M406DRAFT_341102 [Cryphonectria parasitica EP155]KAF3763638.1 hypothetical protein M406DRAFT_341102 [Cryphonectria parasitica EP155]
MLLLIVQQLHETPECIFALALTCKTLHMILIPEEPVLEPLARDSLLLLLEKDAEVGSQFYFCPICHKLHRFSPSYSPLTHEHTMYNSQIRYLLIDDELFLCATHTANSYGIPDCSLRSTIDQRYTYFICHHVDPSYKITALKMPKPPSCDAGEQFSECRDVVESCTMCLTDHCTTIERKRAPKQVLRNYFFGDRHWPVSTGWIITIVAYYQLGRCRSPFDWKWRAITGLTRPDWGNWRDNDRYPPGSIREKWLLSTSQQISEDMQ